MKFLDNLFGALPRHVTDTVMETLRRRKTSLLALELQRRATRAAADIVEERMAQAVFCRSKFEVFDVAIKDLPSGQILEFGVYKGTTINYIAQKAPGRQVVGFDSFKGLPKPWMGYRHSARNFNRSGVLPKVEQNVELVPGWFDTTVSPYLAVHRDPVALLHIDSDLYDSAMTVLRAARDLIQPGTVVVFDEYFNYPGFAAHEFRAWDEFVAEAGISYTFLAYSGEQAALRVDAIGAGAEVIAA